jgi:DNA-directed RNA polymerase subunit RPC12/RpoP
MSKGIAVFEVEKAPDYISDLAKGSVFKCPRCGAILFTGNLKVGSALEIWCKRCKTKVIFAIP